MIATEIPEEHSKGGVRKRLQGSHATGRNVAVIVLGNHNLSPKKNIHNPPE